MPVYIDQLNRSVFLPKMPKRVVSLVPSQTELLFDVGLGEEIVGITKFCVHPAEQVKNVCKIGGTKQLDILKIKLLQPHLIIANKEENERGQVEELMKDCPVWVSDINNLGSAIDMIERVGELVGKSSEAKVLATDIARGFNNLLIKPPQKRTAYFIWRKPYMLAGKGTFIDSMLQKCGLTNAFDLARYPEVDAAMLVAAQPEVVLLSSEPYPFRQKHIEEFQALLPNASVKLVDGEMFSWYGSRLLHAPRYFEQLMTTLNQ